MNLLIATVWPTLLVAFALGLVFAAFGGPGRGWPSSLRSVRFATLAVVAIGAGLALAGIVPGRSGLWLEIAVLVCCAYAVGGGVAAVLRRVIVSRGGVDGLPPPAISTPFADRPSP